MNKTNKYLIRKEFLERRNKEIIQTHKLIYQQVEIFLKLLIKKNSFKQKLHLGIYWPLPDEVDLRLLKRILKIPLALPCSTSKGEIEYRKWTNSLLKKDFYGIPAPINETLLSPKDIGMILVPAIAIDSNGIRLGYGSGCFDRLRKNQEWRSIPSFAILPKACVSDSPLPIDSWDIPFDGWITENGKSERNDE